MNMADKGIGWIPEPDTDTFKAATASHPKKSLQEYVDECRKYVRNPALLENGGSLCAKIAALYVFKHNSPELFGNLYKSGVMEKINNDVSASCDYSLLNCFVDILPTKDEQTKRTIKPLIPYEKLEALVCIAEIEMASGNIGQTLLAAIDRAGAEICKYADKVPLHNQDPHYISLLARFQSMDEYSTLCRSNRDTVVLEIAPVEMTKSQLDGVDSLLDKIDRDIFDGEFCKSSLRLVDRIPVYNMSAADKSDENYLELINYRIRKIKEFAAEYESKLAKEPEKKTKENETATLPCFKEYDELPEIELTLVEPEKPKSSFRKWAAAAAFAAASVFGGLAAVDYFTKPAPKPIEAVIEPKQVVEQREISLPIIPIANKIASITEYFAKVPEAASNTVDEINKAVAKLPDILRNASYEPIQTMDWLFIEQLSLENYLMSQNYKALDLNISSIPEIILEPLPEIELTLTEKEQEYLDSSFDNPELELDFSKPIKQCENLELRLE
jgi:hypothetical protein